MRNFCIFLFTFLYVYLSPTTCAVAGPCSVIVQTLANAKSQFILQVNIIGSRCNCAFKRYNDGRSCADGTVSGCRVVRRGWINVDAAVAHGPR